MSDHAPHRLGLRRLAWAGIELSDGAIRLMVDPLENVEPLAGFLGAPRSPLEPLDVDDRAWALVTHLHPDHCDRGLLRRVADRQVLCHEPIAADLAAEAVTAVGVELWDTVEIADLKVTPVPSHDWRGDDQVAWVIETNGLRIIHCGDTIWHGSWYEIQRRFESFDVAFVPINAVHAQLEGFTPTDVPATMTPEQAIEAAVILRASAACAIHHGLFHNPPKYVEEPDVVSRFLAAGERRGVRALVPPDQRALT